MKVTVKVSEFTVKAPPAFAPNWLFSSTAFVVLFVLKLTMLSALMASLKVMVIPESRGVPVAPFAGVVDTTARGGGGFTEVVPVVKEKVYGEASVSPSVVTASFTLTV